MSNLTKGNNETMQRSELHRKIRAIADDVRGAVVGWDFRPNTVEDKGFFILPS